MASKLFHAVVWSGISLGAVAACDPLEAPGVGAAPSEGGADAASDVSDAAFCDTAWPTTKGGTEQHHEMPACVVTSNPECKPDGLPFRCVLPDDPCGMRAIASVCVGSQWQCPPGRTVLDACLCPSRDAFYLTCSDAGADAGPLGDGGGPQ